MNDRMTRFIRQRGPGLLFLLILLLIFIGFMFTRGGLDISPPEYQSLSPHRNVATGRVTNVYDGDTIKVRLANKDKSVHIRILGMDCPESSPNEKCREDEQRGWLSCEQQVPLGQRAKKMAHRMLMGDTVTLKSGTNEGFKTDPHGRGLAYVHMADGTDYGLKMVKRGQCRDFSDAFTHPRMDTYRKQQYDGNKYHIKLND